MQVISRPVRHSKFFTDALLDCRPLALVTFGFTPPAFSDKLITFFAGIMQCSTYYNSKSIFNFSFGTCYGNKEKVTVLYYHEHEQ